MSEGKVVIVGGGVGGLSAAHHLVNSGFEVEVYEYHDIPGGKARSLGVHGTGTHGRHDLPAEHGFRFFPGYYHHIIETMKEIPFWNRQTSVEDQLVQVHFIGFANFTRPPNLLLSKFPHTIYGWIKQWYKVRNQPRPHFGKGELRFYFSRLWQIVTSCNERREDQYEVIPWWDFIGAGERSLNYQRYLANLSRTLVAANPQKVSTRTNGNILVQTLMGLWGPHADRVLNGPTNEVWIHPWVKYLLSKGVKYYVNAEALELETTSQRVSGVRIRHTEKPRKFAGIKRMARITDVDRYGITAYEEVQEPEFTAIGDYYISAVPVERMAEFIQVSTENKDTRQTPTLTEIDPSLSRIPQLAHSVQWMNGMQCYLKNSPGAPNPPNLRGHTIYADAPYALTSIFQPQYWGEAVDLSKYGDGTVTNICSLDISNWMEAHGRMYDKPAHKLTRTQVKEEVWEDLKGSLKHMDSCRIEDHNLVHWYLDSDIHPDECAGLRNREPLLVNRVNTLRLRPEAEIGIENLFLASDYVRTFSDLATMEAANEAARRAVNAILDKAGSSAPRCVVRKIPQPEFLKPFRDHDFIRYQRGEKWSKRFPVFMKLRLYWLIIITLLGLKRW